ncbi:MAG: FecR domain-containing protein [Lachnospiraceae bacterium]|nr:FecR domain-containing protein [Lachnospiraceae bacterium]
MENKNKQKKKKIVIITAAIIAVLAAVILVLYFRSQIRATTMRILRMEGEVSLEENGKKKTATENLRLNSGNALSTEIKSLVSIGLDDTKIVTLDELSRAIFNQVGRQLDLELTDGSLFFEVQKPLEDDETMNIRTTTMIVGIRGTSGWVSVGGVERALL